MAFNVISNITLDMKHAYSVSNIVQVNQYDTAGVIKAQLLNDGAKWSVPQSAKPVVMFKKTDNIGGFYDVTDTDPETAAVSIDTDRSIIYISLDPQTTTTATSNGKYVDMQVAFFENGLRISTFAFYMQVLPSVITSGDLLPDKNKQFTSSWIFNILSKEIADTLTVATTPDAMTDWLEANITQETGYVIDNTLTVAGAASDAQATGKMVTVSNLNPNTVANKVWVKKTPATLEIPTMEDMDDLESAFVNKNYFAKTFSDSTAIETVDGYSIGTDGTYNAVTYTTTAMDEDSYYRINDGATSITFTKIGTGAKLNAYIRFYDDEFKPLGNGGQASALSGTVNVTAAGNANLSKDAKWIKFGGSGFTQATISVTNATAGKFISVNTTFVQLIAVDNGLQSQINNIETWEVSNLVNPSEVQLNKYWQGRNSIASVDGYALIEIPVKAGYPYSVNGYIDKDFSWYYVSSSTYSAIKDLDEAVYGSSATFIGLKNFVPEYDGFLRITSRNQYIGTSISVVQYAEQPSSFSDYGDHIFSILYGETVGNIVRYEVKVKKDGSGDFTKLIDAIYFSNSHPYTTIYVGEGEYDLVDELGNDYFDGINSSSSEVSGLHLYNHVHLIFSSNSIVKCNYTGNNQYVKSRFSAFNAHRGNHDGFIIENINLQCSNIRYCVHDETGGQIAPYKNEYRNCKMYIDNTQNDAWTSEACIGGGLGCASEILIENSWFDSAITSGWYPDVVSYHNTNAIHSPCRSNIVITGCYFAGRSRCCVSHYGTHDEMSQCIISNCSLASAPRVRFEDQTNYPQENFELFSWNNEIRT